MTRSSPIRKPLPRYVIIAIEGEYFAPIAINEKGTLLLNTNGGAPYYLYDENVTTQIPMPATFTVPGYHFDPDPHPVYEMAATDLSEDGTVVGWLQTDGTWINQVAFSWRKNEEAVSILRDSLIGNLDEPADFAYSYTPAAINQANEIVGQNYYTEAIYWTGASAVPNFFGGSRTDLLCRNHIDSLLEMG